MRVDGGFEFLHEHGHSFGAALAMADREVDLHALGGRAVAEEHLYGVAYVALICRVVFPRESWVLANFHLCAQGVDARVGGDLVLVVLRREPSE